jgi:hypothetical protein
VDKASGISIDLLTTFDPSGSDHSSQAETARLAVRTKRTIRRRIWDSQSFVQDQDSRLGHKRTYVLGLALSGS